MFVFISCCLLVFQVISNATLYILLHSFAGESCSRNSIYLDSSCLAGFHAIPFVEQTLSYFIEVVGSLLVGKRLNLYYLSFLDIDRKGRIATKSFYVFTQRGGIDDVSRLSGNLVGISINLCKSIQKELFINDTHSDALKALIFALKDSAAALDDLFL